VQDDVTGQIIAALKSELGDAITSRADRPLTSSQEAYDLYLRGRANINRRTGEANALAQDLLEQAIGLDGTFAAAYAELSHARFLAWYYGWADAPVALENAEKAARRAVSIDPSLPQGHAQLGWVLSFRGRLDEGIASARHATVLDTNYATGYANLSILLIFSGEGDEALAAGNVAVRLDPFSVLAQLGRGLAQLILRDYEKAAANFRASLEINPDFGAGHQYLAATYGLLGRDEEARAEAAEALSTSPDFADVILGLPFRNRADLMLIVDGLRKAGLDVPDPPPVNLIRNE
jgi:adenylate cyclase